MLSFLKDHPFAVQAFFERSLVLTFAIPKEEAYQLIPPCLEPDTLNDQWAFIAAAMVETKNLRPKGFPSFMGNDFFLIGYRVFVLYKNNAGKRLRGLYILGSTTNKRKMQFFGNIFTHYNYKTTDIIQEKEGNKLNIHSGSSNFHVTANLNGSEETELPLESPFQDWKQARRFAGPLPFTFTFDPKTNKVLIIEGVRENWEPRPVQVLEQHFSFIDDLNLKEVKLANAFVIENIPYYWKKGKSELWKPA